MWVIWTIFYLLRGLSSYLWSLHCSGSWGGSVSGLSLSGLNSGIPPWLWEPECQLTRRTTTKDLDSRFRTLTVPTLWRMDQRSTRQGAGVGSSHGFCSNATKKFWKYQLNLWWLRERWASTNPSPSQFLRGKQVLGKGEEWDLKFFASEKRQHPIYYLPRALLLKWLAENHHNERGKLIGDHLPWALSTSFLEAVNCMLLKRPIPHHSEAPQISNRGK